MTAEGEDADRLWAAIADPTRQQLLDLILASGDATATALARDLPITRQGIAKHLAVLERAGLVEATRTGREVRFTVREDRLDQATRRMAQVVARWDERLATIKRIAETERAPPRGPGRACDAGRPRAPAGGQLSVAAGALEPTWGRSRVSSTSSASMW